MTKIAFGIALGILFTFMWLDPEKTFTTLENAYGYAKQQITGGIQQAKARNMDL